MLDFLLGNDALSAVVAFGLVLIPAIIIHELGHFFLHSNMGEVPIVAYRQGSTRIEWEANWFAASLLMPKVEFLAALKETDDLTRIAAKFKVSCEAARVRKEAIG